jgi:PAS domain S-box-containing protein
MNEMNGLISTGATGLAESATPVSSNSGHGSGDFEQLFALSSDLLSIVDFQGRFLRVNPAWTVSLGWNAEEILGRTFLELIHPEDVADTVAAAGRLRSGQTVCGFENRYRGADNHYRWLSWSSYPNLSAKTIFSVARDVTDRHIQETALLLSEKRFSDAFEHAPHGMALASLTGKFLKVNKALCQLLEYGEDELLNLNFQQLTHEEDLPGCLAHIARQIAGEQVPFSSEKRYRSKSGKYVSTLVSCSTVRDALGQPVHFISQIQDITLQKSVIEEMRKARDGAEAANRAKSEFLAIMSHEIRTPMNGVLGFSSLLAESVLNEEQQRFVRHIQQSGETLLNLINDILEFSKIEAGKIELEETVFDFRQIAEEVVSFLFPKASEKGLFLHLQFSDEIPKKIYSDAGRIRQVLLNLTCNAVKFTETGGVVVEIALSGNAQCKVSVIDSGMGIPHEKLGQLFREFTQLDSSTTRRFGGTGLGLAISRRLTELLGGEIGVESTPGAGSVFWFTLPLCTAEPDIESLDRDPLDAGTPVSNAAVPVDPCLSGVRVLVVEDNSANQLFAVYLLNKVGCTVGLAANGREAVAQFSQLPYDVILMDCYMPEMDGFEATKAIRQLGQRGRDIPIIAVTASITKADQEHCKSAGMNDFLPKPWSREGLVRLLRKWARPKRRKSPTSTTPSPTSPQPLVVL